MPNKISRRNFLRELSVGAVLILSQDESLNGQGRIWTRNFIPVNSKPIRLPNIIAVSSNEQYASFPIDNHRKLNRKNVNIVMRDMKGGDIKKIGSLERIFSLEVNNKGKVAYSTGAFISNSKIGLLPDELIIKNARSPKFSPEGNLLTYENNRGIMLRDLERDNEKLLVDGRVIGFSPDSKKLAYVSFYKTFSRIGREYFLEVCNINNRDIQRVFNVKDGGGLILPFWLDNNHIGFQTIKQKEDSEIYVSDLNGNLEQVTNNGLEEFNPQISNGKIFYALETKDFNRYYFCIAEKQNNGWVSKTIERVSLNTPYFGIAGDKLIYSGEEGRVLIRNLKID